MFRWKFRWRWPGVMPAEALPCPGPLAEPLAPLFGDGELEGVRSVRPLEDDDEEDEDVDDESESESRVAAESES